MVKILNSIRIISVIVIFCIFCFNCSTLVSYDIRIINTTAYTLDKIDYGWCNGEKNENLSLNIGENSSIFTLAYEETPLNLFASGSLCLSVIAYHNDNVHVTDNTVGEAFLRSELDPDTVNVFEITEIPGAEPPDIFDIKLVQ